MKAGCLTSCSLLNFFFPPWFSPLFSRSVKFLSPWRITKRIGEEDFGQPAGARGPANRMRLEKRGKGRGRRVGQSLSSLRVAQAAPRELGSETARPLPRLCGRRARSRFSLSRWRDRRACGCPSCLIKKKGRNVLVSGGENSLFPGCLPLLVCYIQVRNTHASMG